MSQTSALLQKGVREREGSASTAGHGGARAESDSPARTATALFLHSVREKRGWVAINISASVVAALFEGTTFGAILLALRVLSGGRDLVIEQVRSGPKLAAGLALIAGRMSTNQLFAVCIVVAILLQALRSAVTCIAISASVNVGTHIQARIQSAVFRQITRLSYGFASRYKAGDLVDVATAPGIAVFETVTIAGDLLVGIVTLFCYAWLLLKISVNLTIIALMLLGVTALLQRGLMQKIRDRSVQMGHAGSILSQRVSESVQALRTIHSFHRQAETSREYDNSLADVVEQTRHIHAWIALLRPMSESLSLVAVGGLLVIGALLLHPEGSSQIAPLIVFTAVLNRMAGRATQMSGSVAEIARRSGQVRRAEEMLKQDDKEYVQRSGAVFPGLKNAVRFEAVTLRYPGSSDYALKNVSLSIPKGRITALVGGSGAGKSSIVDILLGLYQPSSGEVSVDGVPLQAYEPGSWLARIGVVSQDTFLFSGTILENIRFGMPQASDAEVMAAAKIAHAEEFINLLPLGYSTSVGERGFGLSGGQRQRLALARAVLRQPELLVLDEATSALDSVSESLIQDAVAQFSHGRTVLVVAHRLSTIRHADSIVLLSHGSIEEAGSHVELLQRGGTYARYWSLQTASVAPTD